MARSAARSRRRARRRMGTKGRSGSCRSRCARSRSTMNGGSGIVATEAAVFVSSSLRSGPDRRSDGGWSGSSSGDRGQNERCRGFPLSAGPSVIAASSSSPVPVTVSGTLPRPGWGPRAVEVPPVPPAPACPRLDTAPAFATISMIDISTIVRGGDAWNRSEAGVRTVCRALPAHPCQPQRWTETRLRDHAEMSSRGPADRWVPARSMRRWSASRSSGSSSRCRRSTVAGRIASPPSEPPISPTQLRGLSAFVDQGLRRLGESQS